MRLLIKYVSWITILLIAGLLAVQSSEAGEPWRLLKLDELSVDYRNYALVNDKARNLLTYPEHPKEALRLNINSSLARVIGWNSTVESYTTGAQYKSVGLETALFVRLSPSLEAGYYHRSQHVLDGKHPYMKFAVEDALTLKLYFYRVDKPTNTLLR